jgi:Predicted metal-binding integral membrane protein (DUF2182)
VTSRPAVVANRLCRLSPSVTSALLIVAAAAWLITISLARDMGVMPGTMGLGLIGFVGVWSLMMGAMMLPSISPLSSLYARTIRDNRFIRLTLLTLGYLAVWAAAGFVAYVLATGGERLAVHAPGWAQAVAVGSCFACGIYQMTSVKDRCLQHCRSPLGHLIHYTSLTGRWSTSASASIMVPGASVVAGRSWCCS